MTVGWLQAMERTTYSEERRKVNAEKPRMGKSCYQYSKFNEWRLRQMGIFVACAMRFLPNTQRGLLIREIQKLQDRKHNKLSLQLMRLENYRLNKEFYEDPKNKLYYVPRSYTDAVLEYIATVPVCDREPVLNAILEIIEEITDEEICI